MRRLWALAVVAVGVVLAAAGAQASVVTGVSPSVIVAGASATVIGVAGSGFAAGEQARVNGVVIATTYVDAATLSAIVPSYLLAVDQSLRVDSIGSGGEVSTGAVVLTVGAGGDPQGLSMEQWHTVVYSLLGGLGAYLFVAGVGRLW